MRSKYYIGGKLVHRFGRSFGALAFGVVIPQRLPILLNNFQDNFELREILGCTKMF